MKKACLCLVLLILFSAVFLLGGCDNGGGAQKAGNITLTIVSKTDMSDWGDIEFCTHHYSVSGAKAEIPKTILPHNETTVIELPKTNDTYKLTFHTQGVYADGKTPSKPKEYHREFKGNKFVTVTFTCELRGSMHGHGLEK